MTPPNVPGPRAAADVVSVVDVLANALGELTAERVARLSKEEINHLAEVVNVFYDEWSPPPVGEDDLRLYPGGWIVGNLEAPEARQHLYTSLLYAPSVVMHDPVAEWFDPGRDRLDAPPAIRGLNGMQIQGAEPQLLRGDGYYQFREEPDRTRAWLSHAVPVVAELAPLIRQGIVVPVPHWRVVRPRQTPILSAVRHDVKDSELGDLISGSTEFAPARADRIRGFDVTPGGGVVPADRLRAVVQNPSYFLNKTLAIADAVSARYTPPAAIDAALLEHRAKRLGDELARKDVDLQVVAGLAAADLPFLGELDAATIVAIRRDEQAFTDFRAELRSTARAIEKTPSEGAEFVKEANEVISDALLPKVHEVERTTSRSNVMKGAAKDQTIRFGLGAASVTGAAVIAGTPIAPAALAGLGISAAGQWVYSSLFGSKPAGTHGILATLIKRQRP